MPSFNKFSYLPQVPYRIIEHLIFNNENIWKILKYPEYDCLDKPNLTLAEKTALIWKGQDNQQDFNVFLSHLIENMIPDTKTILKIYKVDSLPSNHILSIVSYEMDILFGGKIGLIDYEGIPCSRGDVFETELMKTLNGADVSGVGKLQFNFELSRLCRSRLNLGNDQTYQGTSIIMATQVGDI